MTVLRIEVETITYEEGTENEETLHEVDCLLTDGIDENVHWEFTLNILDYPDDSDIQNYVTSYLTDQGITWDSVELVHV